MILNVFRSDLLSRNIKQNQGTDPDFMNIYIFLSLVYNLLLLLLLLFIKIITVYVNFNKCLFL